MFALPAAVLAAVYAVRWEIELLFPELTSQLQIAHTPSGNKAATECMLFASLLALALGRNVPREFAPRADADARGALVILFRSVSPLLLDLPIGAPSHGRHLARRSHRFLRFERPDPIAAASRCTARSRYYPFSTELTEWAIRQLCPSGFRFEYLFSRIEAPRRRSPTPERRAL